MKIGIFVVGVGEKGGGLETYQLELVRAIAKLDTENEYFVYCTTPKAVEAIAVTQDNVNYRVLRPSSRWISIPVGLPVQLMRDGVDFYHATMIPPPVSPKPYILSVLCFSSWSHPEFFRKDVLRRLNFLLNIGVRKADYLLCNSANLLDDIHKNFGVAKDRLAVTYLGVGPQFTPQPLEEARRLLADRYDIHGPFVLFVGKNQERKNAPGVTRAFAAYRKATGSTAKLVLVGRGPEATDPISEAIRELDLADHVQRLAYVPYDDLPPLYSAARMFMFPSFWEGFGLPVIESMACGTPVVAGNISSLPEVAGEAAIIVDPASVDQIADGMIRIESDADFRATLIQRGLERKNVFTWENCARDTIEYYHRMGSR
jgi:glycosyltransferase involved in cell wall biosynthesis